MQYFALNIKSTDHKEKISSTNCSFLNFNESHCNGEIPLAHFKSTFLDYPEAVDDLEENYFFPIFS